MHLNFVPKKIFFTKGVGVHKEELQSFELALRAAGIEKFNLVYVSSIFPPKCKIITPEEGLKDLSPGEIVFAVLARCGSNEPHRSVSASIGCAKKSHSSAYGYLSEHHSYGAKDEHQVGKYAEKLAFSMLESTMGITDENQESWDEQSKTHQTKKDAIKTFNTTQFAIVKDKRYTTAVAAAIFVL